MENSAQDIISLIVSYTSELEALDQLNNTYLMTCIGVVGAILGIIATAFSMGKGNFKTQLYRMVPFLFLSIPVVGCAFLCVVTLNCRKVAMYRGYLAYLETTYNKIEGNIPQYYNTNTQQFLSKWWFNNPNGSMMNRMIDIAFVFLIIILLVLCFYFAAKTCKNADGYGSKSLKKYFPIIYAFVLIGCIVICATSCYDLLINSVTFDKVLYEISLLK